MFDFRRAMPAVVSLLLSISPAQDQGFRTGVRNVAIYATVTDRDGRLVTDLDAADFEVLDNGGSVPIATFSNAPQPISAVLLLGTSFIVAPEFLNVRDTVRHFIDALEAQDRVRLGSYGTEVVLSPALTGDKALLNAILDEEFWPGTGATPLLRALDLAMVSIDGERGRRVVVVFGGGQLTAGSSSLSVEDVQRQARERDVMVYAVRLRARFGTGPELGSIARETGGGDFELPREANLAAIGTRLADELRHQYVIGFAPVTLDERVHRLDVRVTSRSGLTVRARRSYLARLK